MKRGSVFVSILLAFALVVSVPFIAHTANYSQTWYDPVGANGTLVTNLNNIPPGTTDDTYTGGADFSSGFNLKSVQIDVDTVANGGTMVVTMTFPCQPGNGNPSTDGECAALNLGVNCSDDDPDSDCDGVLNSLDDAPDTANANSESYRLDFYNDLWSVPGVNVMSVQVRPGIVFPGANIFVDLGPGVVITPSSINFSTLATKQIIFTLTNVNNVMSLNQSWGFFAFANAEFDGPGEDSFRGDIFVEQLPGLNCVRKTFDQTTLQTANGVVTATVSIENTGDVDIFDLVITDVMSNPAKMTIVPGSSTLPGGDPVEAPLGTWTFPPQTLLAGATLTFSYQVQITDLQVGEELCNQVTAASEAEEISSDGPRCSACVDRTTYTVPALGAVGFSVAFALLTVGGIILHRQRRRKA